MRRYRMEDRSALDWDGLAASPRVDENLSLMQVFYMTDYTEEEFNQVAELEVGQEMFLGEDEDIYIKRTE